MALRPVRVADSNNRICVRGLTLAASTAMLLCLHPAFAANFDDHAATFDIPPQSLESALAQYAKQAHVQLVAPSNLVGGYQTAGLSGEHSATQGLQSLLQPAGLTYSVTDAHTLAVVRQPPQLAQLTLADTAANGLEEVVVTARRKEEKLQRVPVSVSVLNQGAFQQNNIQSIRDMANYVPSLFIGAGLPDFFPVTLRGLGAYQAGGTPSTATYLNEVPIPPTQNGGDATGDRYYDLENLQVLLGPQGTLFGRNTTGGALLYQSKRPSNNFEGYFDVTLGNYEQHDFDFALNVPIVDDKVLLRVAGQRLARDGYVHETSEPAYPNGLDIFNHDVWAGRATLTLRPIDDFQNDTIFEVLSQHNNGPGWETAAVNPSSLARTFFPTLTSLLAQQQALGPYTIPPTNVNTLIDVHTLTVTDIMRYDVTDDITLRNIAAYFVSTYATQQSFTGNMLPVLDSYYSYPGATKTDQVTEEAQILGKSFDHNLDWVAGFFFENDTQPDFDDLIQLVLGARKENANQNQSNSKALYAQGTYDLSALLDGLKFTGGFRYTWDARSITTMSAPYSAATTQSLHGNFHAPTWTVGLDYQVLPDTMVYLTASRGYRSGGFNTGNLVLPIALDVYGPEYVTNLEAGIKSDWTLWGMKARTNLAAYYEWYDSIQINQTIPVIENGSTVLAGVVQNAGSAVLHGGEFEGQLYPIPDLQLSGTASYSNKRFTSLAAGVNPAIATFNPELVPAYQLTAGAHYHLPLDAALGDITVGTTWTWVSKYIDAIDNRTEPFEDIKSHGLLNFDAAWNSVMGSSIDLSFYMTNVTNKTYILAAEPFYYSIGFDNVAYGPPRMFGFHARYRFGGPSNEPESTPTAYTPPPVQAPAPVAHSYMVFFDFNKSDLTSQAVSIVDQAASNAGPAHVTQITCTGHTDTVGSDAYNIRLSRRRSESVAAELEKQGIPSSEIEIVAKGKQDLLVPTADGVKEPQNRRVQIVYSGATS